jgi:REP element-mobilizing transposase RayT
MRQPRSYQPGHIYHIIQRGNNHEFIFDADSEKRHLLKILRTITSEMPCYILHYVIMGNHYHLLVEMQDIPLNQIMQRINLRYSQYFNRQNHRSGATFSENMVAIDVHDLGYLHTLLAYLANNPVRAGITPDPESYPWSAHNTLLSNRRSFVAKDRLYTHIAPGLTPLEAQNRYHQIVRTYRNLNPIPQDIFIKNQRIAKLQTIFNHYLKTIGHDPLENQEILVFATFAYENGFTPSEIARIVRRSTRTLRRFLMKPNQE